MKLKNLLLIFTFFFAFTFIGCDTDEVVNEENTQNVDETKNNEEENNNDNQYNDEDKEDEDNEDDNNNEEDSNNEDENDGNQDNENDEEETPILPTEPSLTLDEFQEFMYGTWEGVTYMQFTNPNPDTTRIRADISYMFDRNQNYYNSRDSSILYNGGIYQFYLRGTTISQSFRMFSILVSHQPSNQYMIQYRFEHNVTEPTALTVREIINENTIKCFAYEWGYFTLYRQYVD